MKEHKEIIKERIKAELSLDLEMEHPCTLSGRRNQVVQESPMQSKEMCK